MIKYFKTFFYPTVLTYSYDEPKELVIGKIKDVFRQKVTLLSSKDMTGYFLNSDTFIINAESPAYTRGVKYSSTLVGQVIQSQTGVTEIKTKAKPSFIFYILFFVTIIFGLIYLYQFMQTGETDFLFWSMALLILGPAISIGFSNVAIASIYERYQMYIHKELKKLTELKTAANIVLPKAGQKNI